MKYTVHTNGEGPMTVTALSDGLVMIADRSHPNFEQIVAEAERYERAGHAFRVPEEDQKRFQGLFDLSVAVKELFKVTDRVSLQGSTLIFDGKPVEGVLADHVVRAIKEGHDETSYLPFVRFWERVQANPNEHSRENLMRWLMAEQFTITDDGFIVGYKGVRADLTSNSSGPGVVNGVSCNGHLDNSPGNVVEVARSYVEHDPNSACAQGLHVGTWKYANGFGVKTLEVWVDPADVVSVPTDCNGAKMRVCKYTVKRLLNEGYSLAVLKTQPEPVDEDDEEYCPECGSENCYDEDCTRCDECGEYGCDSECIYCDCCGEYGEECECDESCKP